MDGYRVNHIFYSLQGEGRNTGRAAAFVRFAGCNLRCPFCDTEFDTYRTMTGEEIVQAIDALVMADGSLPAVLPQVVLTGGEPTLQADEAFIDLLHSHGYEVAMESNGTCPAPRNLDWLTVSPKEEGMPKGASSGKQPDELKIVFDEHTDPQAILDTLASQTSMTIPQLCFLQPCDTGDAKRNAVLMKHCIDYIKSHPQWRLSLQTHKLIGIE